MSANTVPEPDYQTLRLHVRDHIATVELHRPDAMNAMNMQMLFELGRVFGSIDDDPSVWAVILTGQGRAFCVGADLKERQTMAVADVSRRRRLAPRILGGVARCRRPVIAAVNGFAFGGGFELALLCDILLAGESARFALPETSLGVIPGGGATQRLPRMIGTHKAKELIFTGRRLDAQEALALGILNRVVPDAALMEEARTLAAQMLANAPMALQQAKRAIDATANMGLEAGLEFEAEAYQACLASSDRSEALAAVRDKRKPRFIGA